MPPANPPILGASDPNYWEAVGKMLDGLTELLILQFPDDKSVRVSAKVLKGAINGLIEGMSESEPKG